MKSVLNRPSQQVRRELALGERFLGFSGRSRSTGPSQKPQESCHPAGGSDGRRERITLNLADGVRPDANAPGERQRGRIPLALNTAKSRISPRFAARLPWGMCGQSRPPPIHKLASKSTCNAQLSARQFIFLLNIGKHPT